MSSAIYGLTGFESFEGATSRIGNLPAPSLAHGRGAGKKGVGINGLGLMIGHGWSTTLGSPSTLVGTVGFAFKNWGDKQWGGEVWLVDVYNGFTGTTKARLGITAQKQLTLWSYDAELGGLVLRAISSASLKDDAWHYLEFCYGAGGGPSCDTPSNGLVEVGINGRLVASYTGSTDICPEDDHGDEFHPWRGVTGFHIGVLSGFLNEDHHMSFDDVYSSAAIVFVGDVFASEMALAADVATELVAVPGPTNVGMLTEDPPDDASTYNAHQEVGYKEDRFSVVDPAGTGLIFGIQLTSRTRKTRTARWRFQPFVETPDYISYHLGDYLTYNVWTDLPNRVFWEAPGPPDEDGYIIGHEWTWEEVAALVVGYVMWPPTFFFGTDYGDKFPAVYIQI